MARVWLVGAAVNGFIAVAMGAAAAHGLAARLDTGRLAWVRTAVDYQMWHALALLAAAWLSTTGRGDRLPLLAGAAFLLGTVLFCGSLYLLAFTGSRSLAWITPIGGLSFLVGWAALGAAGVAGRGALR